MKFGRIYTMIAQGESGFLHQINFPLTCRFHIRNNTNITTGSGVFQIFNLTKDVRSDLYQDEFDIIQYRQLVFAAGYEGDPTRPVVIFKGNIKQCHSYRQGPDWITEIIGFDGGFAISISDANLTIPKDYGFRYAISNLCRALSPTVQVGLIGNIDDTVVSKARGLTTIGNPWDLIVRTATPLGLLTFIYQEKIYVVKQDEFIASDGAFNLISADTGMLGSPRLQRTIVVARMIFEPRIEVFQRVELQTIEARMNGFYIVQTIVHRGTISGAVCENLETEVTMYQPDRLTARQVAA